MIRPIARILAAVAVTAGLTASTPAHADAVGVNACTASGPSRSSMTCVFVAEPGTYTLEIHTTGIRYAWADVHCNQQQRPSPPYLFVDVWDTDGRYDFKTGPLPGGVCVLYLAVGGLSVGSTSGSAIAYVHM